MKGNAGSWPAASTPLTRVLGGGRRRLLQIAKLLPQLVAPVGHDALQHRHPLLEGFDPLSGRRIGLGGGLTIIVITVAAMSGALAGPDHRANRHDEHDGEHEFEYVHHSSLSF